MALMTVGSCLVCSSPACIESLTDLPDAGVLTDAGAFTESGGITDFNIAYSNVADCNVADASPADYGNFGVTRSVGWEDVMCQQDQEGITIGSGSGFFGIGSDSGCYD